MRFSNIFVSCGLNLLKIIHLVDMTCNGFLVAFTDCDKFELIKKKCYGFKFSVHN